MSSSVILRMESWSLRKLFRTFSRKLLRKRGRHVIWRSSADLTLIRGSPCFSMLLETWAMNVFRLCCALRRVIANGRSFLLFPLLRPRSSFTLILTRDQIKLSWKSLPQNSPKSFRGNTVGRSTAGRMLVKSPCRGLLLLAFMFLIRMLSLSGSREPSGAVALTRMPCVQSSLTHFVRSGVFNTPSCSNAPFPCLGQDFGIISWNAWGLFCVDPILRDAEICELHSLCRKLCIICLQEIHSTEADLLCRLVASSEAMSSSPLVICVMANFVGMLVLLGF